MSEHAYAYTSGFVHTPALRMHYAEWSRQGVPIVLLHGLSSTRHIWDLVAPQLAQYAHVIALDQRGHGLTSQPDTGYDLDTVSDDLITFTQAIGLQEPFWVVGHSWGAAVALNTTTRHPKHVRGLVLVDGGFVDLKHWMPTWANAEARLTPPSLSHLTLEQLRDGMRDNWLRAAWSPAVEAAAMHGFSADSNGNAQRRLSLANHMQIAKSLWEFTPAQHFPTLTCPVLIAPARGHFDPAREHTRTLAIEATAQQLAHTRSQITWFDDTLHDIPWHRPTELAHTINTFIKN